MKVIKRIDTVFIPVMDLEKSEEWYTNIFPFKVVYRDSDGYVGFRINEPGELKTGLTLYKVDEMPQSKHIAFNFFTEDIDGFHASLKEQGVDVNDIHSGGGMRFFEFTDPSGNLLGAVTFKEITVDQMK